MSLRFRCSCRSAITYSSPWFRLSLLAYFYAGEGHGGAEILEGRCAGKALFDAESIDLDQRGVAIGAIGEFVFIVANSSRRFVGPDGATGQNSGQSQGRDVSAHSEGLMCDPVAAPRVYGRLLCGVAEGTGLFILTYIRLAQPPP